MVDRIKRGFSAGLSVINFQLSTNSRIRGEIYDHPPLRTESLQVVMAVRKHPAGCTKLCRVSPTTRDAPLRTERLGVEIPHAAPISICPRSPMQRRRT